MAMVGTIKLRGAGNSGQCATAILAFAATLALQNLQLTESKGSW